MQRIHKIPEIFFSGILLHDPYDDKYYHLSTKNHGDNLPHINQEDDTRVGGKYQLKIKGVSKRIRQGDHRKAYDTTPTSYVNLYP